MALTGAILSVIGAVLILVDTINRWRTTTTVIDGGDAGTDFDTEERKARRRALWSAVGPALVVVGAVLTVVAL